MLYDYSGYDDYLLNADQDDYFEYEYFTDEYGYDCIEKGSSDDTSSLFED